MAGESLRTELHPDAVNGGVAVHPVRYRHGVRRPRWSGYTAFVLSGGGARGALQVGMLRALLERGERPDLVIGTSIGAWNGAGLAHSPDLAGVERLEGVWRELTSSRVLLGRETHASPPGAVVSARYMMAAIQRVTQGYPSLYSHDGSRRLARELYGDLTFEDLAIPLRVVAADLTAGTRAVFGSGPLAAPILASSSIPGIFPPLQIGDHFYVDGGALENVSVDIAIGLGARRLFILDVGYDTTNGHGAPWPGELLSPNAKARGNAPHPLASVLERTSQVMSNYHMNDALNRLPPGIETHIIRPASAATAGGTLDFGRAVEWMAHAYEFTRAYLRGALPIEEPETLAQVGPGVGQNEAAGPQASGQAERPVPVAGRHT
jgi:predicted acylesterase/phospholipase RssA